MNRMNLFRVSGLVLVLLGCGSESEGGTQHPPPARGIEGSGIAARGIQGSGFRPLGIQGTGRSATASKAQAAEISDGEAGATSTE